MSEESRCFRVDETLDYVKDALEHLSDNDELFVSNRNDIKAAPNMSVFRINCSLLNLKYYVFTTMMYMMTLKKYFFFKYILLEFNHGKQKSKIQNLKSRYIILGFLCYLGAGVFLFSVSSVLPG